MKKVGILTFHRAHNYGAVLQCYALQEVLRKKAYEVEIIDFTPESILYSYKPNIKLYGKNPIKWTKSIFRYLNEKKQYLSRYHEFDDFIEEKLQLSKNYGSNFPNQLNDYGVIYIGSDQVWRESITKDANCYFWGKISTSKNTKIISYAASMETKVLSENDRQVCINNLCNFHSISVRESLLVPILKPYTNKKIHVTLDPTLLLDKEDYMKIMSEKVISSDYVLIYELGSNPNVDKLALKIACEKKLNVVKIFIPLVGKKLSRMNKNSFNCVSPSPSQFLRLFNDAKYVVTNSFHGTVFSLIFNKQFFSIETSGKTTRIESLLTLLDIADHVYLKSINNVKISFYNLDYVKINEKIKTCRAESIDFIDKSSC